MNRSYTHSPRGRRRRRVRTNVLQPENADIVALWALCMLVKLGGVEKMTNNFVFFAEGGPHHASVAVFGRPFPCPSFISLPRTH